MHSVKNPVTVTLPDGSACTFPGPVSVLEVATSVSAALARKTVAGIVNGQLVDASDIIDCNASVQIITPENPQGVRIIRHSCAHLIGHAVKQLFPTARMVIGPVIDEGFSDIAYERPLIHEDLTAIESRMRALITKVR